MGGPVSRRNVVLAGGAAAVIVPFASPGASQASIVDAFGYFASGNVVAGVLALVMEGVSYFSDQAKTQRLLDMSRQMVSIAEKQSQIIDALSTQRIVFRQEIRKAFLERDVVVLQGLTKQFNVAVANGSVSTLEVVKNDAVGLAKILASYGVPGLSAYLTAIALENGVHGITNSTPQAFVETNNDHKGNLTRILYGSTENDLPTSRRQVAAMAVDSNDPRAWFGKQYPIARGFFEYTGSDGRLTKGRVLMGYQYEGYGGSAPILKWYSNFYRDDQGRISNMPTSEVATIDRTYRRPMIVEVFEYYSSDFFNTQRTIPTSTFDGRRRAAETGYGGILEARYDLSAAHLAAIDRQKAKIESHYRSLYESGQVDAFSRQSPLIRPSLKDVEGLLLTGIGNVDRLVRVKAAAMASGSYLPI